MSPSAQVEMVLVVSAPLRLVKFDLFAIMWLRVTAGCNCSDRGVSAYGTVIHTVTTAAPCMRAITLAC